MKHIFRKCAASITALALVLSTGAMAIPAFADTTTTLTYDMAQGMAFLDCTNANGMTAASANDGSGMWSFGHTQNGVLTYYPELQRRLWNVAAGKVDAWGGAVQVINDRVVLDPFVSGAIGYGFGTNYEWNTLPLVSADGTHIQPTAVWKAQYPGTVTATLQLGQSTPTESTADGVLYRIEQVSGASTTIVYPDADDTDGWAEVAQGATPETVNFNATVAANDQLVLRFDSNQNDTEDRMSLYSYVLTQTVNNADMTDDIVIDDLAPVTTPEDDTDDTHFSLDSLFAVRNLFTGHTGTDAYLNYRGNRELVGGAPTGLYTGLFPAVENNENSRFEVGYYGLGSAADTFTHFTRLSQSNALAKAPGDPNLDGYVRSLSYGMRVSEVTGDSAGYPVDLTMPAAIGTMFGHNEYPIGNSYPGENVRATVRFTVPRTGVITLNLGMHAPTDAASDGILYKITRFYGENRSRVLTSGYQTAAADQTENWSYLAADTTGALVREVLPEIAVSAGDVIELTFDKNITAAGDLFDLVYYTIHYVDADADKLVYDMGEGLAVSDTFTGDTSSATTEYKNLTPVYQNNESGATPWRYGYFSTAGTFRTATVLTRPWFTSSRAPEDNSENNKNYPTSLSYGYASRLQEENGVYGWDISNNNIGYVGYDFGTDRDGTNSFPGQSNSGRAAVRFVAPKSGTVVPAVTFYDVTAHDADPDTADTHADGVLFKLYKKALDGTVARVYPTTTETTYTASDSTTGWALIPGSGAEAVWKDALVGVNAGDELILQFDPRKYTNDDEFAIRSYTISYQQQQEYSYDLAGAFAVTDTFDGGLDGLYYDYADGLTPATANGVGQWKLGYYNWNTEAFTPFTYLNRGDFMTTRAPEDKSNCFASTASTTLVWSTEGVINTQDAATYVPAGVTATGNAEAKIDTPAAIGYNFSNGRTDVVNSFPGDADGAQAAIRFSVRHAGKIQPVLSLANPADNGGILYRVYKVDGQTGETTTIYPMSGETAYTSADAETSNWCLLPASTTTLLNRDEAEVHVNVGDEIVIRFDKYTTGDPSGKQFIIDTVRMNYLEDLDGAPIENYAKEMTVVYTEEDQILDLRRNKTTAQARGSISYAVTNDIVGALRETATPGIYTLTGNLNDLSDTDREALTVTASYYAPGGTEPAYTTATDLYVRSALREVEPFALKPVKTTNLGLDYDTFMLPYYTDTAERAQYGAIDLQLNDLWEGATVNFSIANEIEYLGDGYVRAVSAYTFSDAGRKAVDSSVTQTLPSAVVLAVRDKNTVGTPITMTVIAPDGTTARYYVLAFMAQIQNLTANAANVYQMLDITYNQTGNALMYYETYDADGNFTPMVRDTGRTTSTIFLERKTAEDRFTDFNHGGGFITPKSQWRYPFPLKNYAENNVGIYTGQVGLAQTFVAPKSGTITMTDFLPGETRTWLSQYMPDMDGGSVSVKLYDENDNLLKTLYTQSWGPVKDANGNFYTDTDGDGTADANEYYPFELQGEAVYDSVTGDRDTGITFAVEEGQKIRLMVQIPYYTNPGYVLTSGSENVPDPVYTYAETAGGIEKTDLGNGTYQYTATTDIAAAAETMHYITAGYDANGEFVAVSDGGEIAVGTMEVTVNLTAPDGISYLKIFFWEDLTNIRPINGGLIIR